MIELKELTLGYGQRTLLETVNARITGGQLVALLGRNGTGKSTLLRLGTRVHCCGLQKYG